MENNIGAADRTVRLVVGSVLGVAGLAILGGLGPGSPVVGVIVLLVGLVLLGTALTRRCLAYRALGIDTSGRR